MYNAICDLLLICLLLVELDWGIQSWKFASICAGFLAEKEVEVNVDVDVWKFTLPPPAGIICGIWFLKMNLCTLASKLLSQSFDLTAAFLLKAVSSCHFQFWWSFTFPSPLSLWFSSVQFHSFYLILLPAMQMRAGCCCRYLICSCVHFLFACTCWLICM